MKVHFLFLLFTELVFLSPASRGALPAQDLQDPVHENLENVTPEAGGDHLRVETQHGPIHLWRPEKYDRRTAGTVIYVHGYFTSVDQAWTEDHLAAQFEESGRNALFVAIEAPQSSADEVCWRSLEQLLTTIEELAPFPLPHGPLIVGGHSGAYRTIVLWLRDPRVRYVVLLDGMYGGQAEFHSWLRAQPNAKPHRIVLVSSDTWRQSSRFARPVYGTARRRSVPADSSNFTPRELHARLLDMRSQYDHDAIVSSGKVIPLLLEISPLKGFTSVIAQPQKTLQRKAPPLGRIRPVSSPATEECISR